MICWRRLVRLAKVKTRYLTNLIDTEWLDINRGTTLFEAGESDQVPSFFKLLETVHPQEGVVHTYEYPKYIEKAGYTKKVQPEKVTTAYAIFEGDSELTKILGNLEPSLYELDQIEVGRRLDNSRWLSFVEISQSARWGDIADNLDLLLDNVNGSFKDQNDLPIFSRGDRLRGRLGEILNLYLEKLSGIVASDQKKLFKDIEYMAKKDKRFQEAIEKTYSYMPNFNFISKDNIETLQNNITFPRPTILLVDGSSITNAEESLTIYKSLKNLGRVSQVLYAVKDRDNLAVDDNELGYWYKLEKNDQQITQLVKKA